MSKLSRYTQKLFASSPGVNQIGKFGSLAAGGAAYAANPSEAMSLSNWLTGWFGAVISGNSPCIEDLNAVHYVYSHQLAYIMQNGVPEWDSGTEYFTGALVNSAGVLYVSKTDNNTNNAVSDTTNWKRHSSEPTGSGKDFWGATLPGGYIWASGKTIGSATSGATERANADTVDLFTMLWTDYSDSILPIYTSAGVLSTRGASAAADFAANKRLTVIDKRGRVSVGKDNLGGSTAGRMTSTTMAPNGTTLGALGGAETHTLSIAQMPVHDHGGQTSGQSQDHWHGVNDAISPPGSGLNANRGSGVSSSYNIPTGGVSQDHVHYISANGAGAAHNNVQPSIVCNYILKL